MRERERQRERQRERERDRKRECSERERERNEEREKVITKANWCWTLLDHPLSDSNFFILNNFYRTDLVKFEVLAGPPMLQRAEEDTEFLEERDKEDDMRELWGIKGLGGALDDSVTVSWGMLSRDRGGTLWGLDGSSTTLLSGIFSDELDQFLLIDCD